MKDDVTRVVWSYSPSASGLFRSEPSETEAMSDRVTPLLEGVEMVGGVEPLIPGSRFQLREQAPSTETLEALPSLDLASYYQAYTPDPENAERLADRLRDDLDVDHVEVRTRPVRPYWQDSGPEDLELEEPPPPAAPSGFGESSTPSFFSYQRYLGAEGLDVLDGWSAPGGRGEDVHVVDVETHWNLRHEELRPRARMAIGHPWGTGEDRDHGTAVLGLLAAEDKGAGIIGLAPSSHPRAASVVWDPNPATGRWNVEAALVRIASLYPPGSVVLLELQERGPRSQGPNDQFGMLPVEYWRSTWAAIRHLASRRYYVVEAAGNGSQDLDDPIYRGRLSRQNDSGAILVGAGNSAFRSPLRRTRCDFSNYGRRLDLQAWGNDVATSGGPLPHYRDLFPRSQPFHPWRCYTRSFGGTSSASALVAGAIACVSGAVRGQRRPPLPVSDLRAVLQRTGAAQRRPSPGAPLEWIGPMPRVAHALRELSLLP